MITFWIPESVVPVDDTLFLEICEKNPDNRIERTKKGEIKIMAPSGGETGKWNASVIGIFYNWNQRKKLGKIFDSSTAFRLPSRAIRSPDLAYVSLARWNSLTTSERESFPPICPDFVLEIRSKSDKLIDLQLKMLEWIESGSQLAWLLDLENQEFYIYRPNKEMEMISGKEAILSGESTLPD
jgi:Uma2 family endonuclease